VYVVKGTVEGDTDLAGALAHVDGDTDDAMLGASVAGPGDVDADGTDDVWLGAPGANGNGAQSGGAFLYYGPLSGARTLSDADARFDGGHPGDALGYVGAAGDLAGDGYPDLLAGAPVAEGDEETAGVVYVLSGAPP
jgi:hypothetical protein